MSATAPGLPRLARERAALETPWPWLGVGLVASAALVGAVLALGEPVRGYTITGLAAGGVTAAACVAAAVYALRKRSLQERWPIGRGTMAMWLWAHVAVGLVAIVALVAHAGFGLVSPIASSGKALALALLGIALSGVAWRLVYAIVPPIAAPRVHNYSRAQSLDRAEQQRTEIEKIAAGKSTAFQELRAWIVANDPSPPRVVQAGASLPPAERADLEEVRRLASSMRRALERHRLQARYTRILQAWRVVHVPLTFALAPLLVVHVVGALELPATLLPVGDVPLAAFSGFAPSSECRQCHRAIYDQWSTSMHAHGLKSPVTIVQNNALLRAELDGQASPDPRQVCVNCHSPVGAALARQAKLPLARDGYDAAHLEEGVSCSSCHQQSAAPASGAGALSRFQRGLVPAGPQLGPIGSPVGNAFHQSATTPVWRAPESLCLSCHDVHYDVNGDGKIVKGIDLVLQQTNQEHEEYRAEGGGATCIGCHMPALAGRTRVAEAASIPFEQDEEAPPRQVHDHSFVGVDYPLDEVEKRDPHKEDRAALLRGAARIALEEGGVVRGALTFKVSITNSGAGHNLPTGFAFARQLWLEVKVADAGGTPLFTSGVLAAPTDDLCDAGTIDDPRNPMIPHLSGCSGSDPQLVSFQQKLVDRIDVARDAGGQRVVNERGELKPIQAEGAKEVAIQHLAGGPVARVRPLDKQALTTLGPNDTRTFEYRATLPAGVAGATVSVRLLFRNLPPYMLRALAAQQPAEEEPKLAPLIKNLQIVELVSIKRPVRVR